MHLLGKVSLWLCMLVLIPLAVVFSTMLLDIRNHWLTQMEKERAQLNSTTKQLDDIRTKVAALDEDYLRLVRNWGEVWGGPGRPLPGTPGGLDIAVGANSGLPAAPVDNAATRPTLFVFADAENQPTMYLGQFSLQAGQGDRIGVALTRSAYPGEVETWPVGNYHVRRNLPSNWLSSPSELHAQILTADAQLAAQRLMLQTVKRQVQASQTILNLRMAELNGDPNAVTGASEVIKDGLVDTIRKLETDRNKLLALTDNLRRDLDGTYVKLREVLDSNTRRVEQMKNTDSTTQPGPVFPLPQASRPARPLSPAMN